MKEIALNVKKRETGKQPAKRMRREGVIPGVYYMSGSDSVAIASDPLSLRQIIYTPSKRIVNLTIEGDPTPKSCVLKDVKFHPVTDKILHFDLLGLDPDRKLSLQVPIVIKGQSAGVRKGGKMQQYLKTAKIKCLPKDLIESLEIDVSKLEMGQKIYIQDIDIENVEYEIPGDTIIVAVFAPRGASASALEEAAAGN